MIRVVGMLSNGMIQRRFQVDMPIVTQGIRGQDMMTRTHATMSAISYGKRGLLVMMFNLAIGDDDDGNRAGGSSQPCAGAQRRARWMSCIDPHSAKSSITSIRSRWRCTKAETWAEFIEPMQRYLNHCRTIAEWDEWMALNGEMLVKLKETKPQLFRLFEKNTEAKHQELTK